MASIFKPSFYPSPNTLEKASVLSLIHSLGLEPHIEGGFFKATYRAKQIVRTPFESSESPKSELTSPRPGFMSGYRNSSTSIYYLLTENGPQGGWHRNKGCIVHTLHRGRAQVVIIHADEKGAEKRIETFVVGQDIEKGEKLQWIVEGGKFKSTYLLPDDQDGKDSQGLLISETVIPGFEDCDHDFLTSEGLNELVGSMKARELDWLLSPLAKK